MLDAIYVLFVFFAILFLFLAIILKKIEPFWNIISIVITTFLWFVIALFHSGGFETGYSCFNSTTGITTFEYSVYASEIYIYLSYFYMLMGILCFIYLIVTIFDYYYTKLEEKLKNQEAEMCD